jgi:O-acetyl-ADP-ribose deacetylase (regulator of RNase III)
MIETIKGDLMTVSRGLIVHGCNAQGVMGSGVAAVVRQKFPKAYEAYMKAHKDTKLTLGTCSFVRVAPELWVINAVTQQFYGSDGKRYVDYKAVERCFDFIEHFAFNLEKHMQYAEKLPVCFPKIGAGLGGGDWSIISKTIEETLAPDRPARLYVID